MQIIDEEIQQFKSFYELSNDLKAKKRINENALNVALDLAGLIPGVGEFADGANALLHAKKGEWLAAAFSLISMIPAVGDAVGKGGKLALYVSKMGKAGKAIQKGAQSEKFIKVAKAIKNAKQAAEKNKDLIDKLFAKAEENEKLKQHVPKIKQAFEAFIKTGNDSSNPANTQQTNENYNFDANRWIILAGLKD